MSLILFEDEMLSLEYIIRISHVMINRDKFDFDVYCASHINNIDNFISFLYKTEEEATAKRKELFNLCNKTQHSESVDDGGSVKVSMSLSKKDCENVEELFKRRNFNSKADVVSDALSFTVSLWGCLDAGDQLLVKTKDGKTHVVIPEF